MSKKQIILLGIAGLFLALLLLWAFTSTSPSHETALPERGAAVQAVYATGEVEPVYWAHIAPQIAGRVESVPVREGQEVKIGELLAGLDDTVERAHAAELRARLEYLEKERKRFATLAAKDAASRSRFEQISSEYDATTSALEAQMQTVNRLAIKSPLDGIVLRRDVEPGETVRTEDIIFWVGTPQPLRVTAEVDEEDIPFIALGQTALITSDAFVGQVIEGTVSEITPKGDPIEKNFRVRIGLPEASPLRVGMTVEVNVVTREEENALLVPTSSVLEGKVWVAEGRDIKERPVKTGIQGTEKTQILEGLQENEAVLVNPAAYLSGK